jgi:hypothetical protein
MAIELNGIPLRGNWPATKREFFRIVGLPNFDFADIGIRETSVFHVFGKGRAIVVRVVLAHKKTFLSTDNDLKEGDKIIRNLTSEVGFKFSEDGC